MQERQSWGFGIATPIFWAGRGCGGSWTGREILLYLIMYRNYVRQWWLLKRNRIIWPEVAVNEQFLPGKSIFFKNFDFFRQFLKKFDFPGKNCSFTATSGQIILFLFKSHHFRTYMYFLYM